MKPNEIKRKYLEFFAAKGHKIVPSASLVPENDPTTLFTGSGMQPILSYLLGVKHPLGTRITDSQKSFRTGDIEEVGDNRHTTFFEMLGNWSFGDYFKKEQLPWMFEFLTNVIKIDPTKLYVTAFIGDAKYDIPKDTEVVDIWKKLFATKGIEAKAVEIGSEANGGKVGMQGGRIFFYDSGKNWWSRAGVPENMPAGEPGGPDSEIFYEFTNIEHDQKFGEFCHPNCDCGRFLEIGNNVFMEYVKNADGTFSKLKQQNVDFGGGLERIAAASIDSSDLFQIEIFKQIITLLEKMSGKSYADKNYTSIFRIVADHIRASVFLISDGVNPSNVERGYFVRRLLRRAVRFWDKLGIKNAGLDSLVDTIVEYYKNDYPDVAEKRAVIADEIKKEETRFRQTLENGLKEFEKGADPFTLYTSYGFPIEITRELAKENGIEIDEKKFQEELKRHQELSRTASSGKFKGGLSGSGGAETKYHTATHLLLASLRSVLKADIVQKGSNITTERMRFDFNWPEKLTKEQLQAVEDLVNKKIAENIPVTMVELPKEQAKNIVTTLSFDLSKYGDIVKVYKIGDFSAEFCGGPHVSNTSELGHFKMVKEEASAAGIRRIKAILE